MILHGYFRSSASWRVRIALALKGLEAGQKSYQLRRGDQVGPAYLALNPQGLVPALTLEDGTVLTQSLAMIDWLDEIFPSPPLLPVGALARAKVRAFALVIAADTHPVQNLKILRRVGKLGVDEAGVTAWAAQANREGLSACEALLGEGPYCFGGSPGLADICLVPQMANARRFGVDVAAFPGLMAREAACLKLPAFVESAPERQPDAV